MAARSLTVDINPELLTWARTSAGFKIEEVAKKFHKQSTILNQWESGEKRPTLRQLERLSEIYRRPLAAFFLPDPPKEPTLPMDFRVPYGQEELSLSPKTRFAIRRARRLQAFGINLFNRLDIRPHLEIQRVTIGADPEKIAREIRSQLKSYSKQQLKWRTFREALTNWRNALESLGIFTFQFSMPSYEVRGFSLPESEIPAIVISSADTVSARIFTLFHELAHLILGQGGICSPTEMELAPADVEIEKFCNHFAGAFLVPLEKLLEFKNEIPKIIEEDILDDLTVHLANRFKVSRYVILRRFLSGGMISHSSFRKMFDKWSKEYDFIEKRKGGGGSPAVKALHQRGLSFVSLVLTARDQGIVSQAALSEYLGVKQQYIGEIESLAAAR